ncbi:MAG: LVIVD repeat-containing protein [Actinomycetota bacterium]
MQSRTRWLVLPVSLMAVALLALPAPADHDTRPHTDNMVSMGHSPHEAAFLSEPAVSRHVNSDLAFWGRRAFNGNYNGWRTIDIADPNSPVELDWYDECNGDQGDIVVWNNVLVRSWNSPAPDPAGPNGRSCGGAPVPLGWEGLHVFDITSPTSPILRGSIELDCGSHTATLVPDMDNDRLLVYNNISSGCDWMDIVQINLPLRSQDDIQYVRAEPITGGSLGSNNGCHDVGVILGDEPRAVCASGHAANVFSLGGSRGGTLENPRLLYTIEEEDGQGNKVGIGGRWHSGTFTWDGKVLAMGWEPGGGAAPECETADPDIKKSMFFYDADTGNKLGQWTLPRGQDGAGENCTIHNYNIVPLNDGRYVAVGGHYQAGTWVVDFTNPASPVTVGWSDPPPLEPTDLGGAWSSYWYNGYIYESEITKGLNVFGVDDPAVAGALRLPFLNPQTQMNRIAQTYTFASDVNIRHRLRPHVFRGRVTSDDAGCVEDRAVRVRKVRPGPDRTVGRDTTDDEGRYVIRHRRGGAGRYYAVVAPSSFAEGINTVVCQRDASGRIRVRR